MRKYFSIALAALAGGFIILQLVLYGRNHTNPPIQSGLAWPDQQTLDLVEWACFDCHCNETV